MPAIGVIYLAWVPLGLPPLERFLASYRHYPAGLSHDLIVVCNGYQNVSELAVYQERLQDMPYLLHSIETPQQDIASYLAAARTFSHDYLCFLNSYSELQAPDWLQKLYNPFSNPSVGLVGATGSWETRQIVVPLRNLRTWLAYRLHNRRWPAFPNPHIRSTGFLLARETMLRLSLPPIQTKEDAYHFEHGFHSMTRQIQGWNLDVLLVDKEGRAFAPEEWPQTRTFRSGDQSQLLITDNRTQLYRDGDLATKRDMTRQAWGSSALPLSE